MENASLEIYKIASEKLRSIDKIGRIGIICGKGNNGGDGFALARHFLNNGYDILVISLFDSSEMTMDCKANYSILRRMMPNFKKSKIIKYRNIRTLDLLKKCTMVVDAMLGSGIQGDLKEPYNLIVNKVNTLNNLKLAVDIPTGLNADKGYSSNLLHADLTVTLGELKTGLFFGDGYAFCGDVKKGNIGISPTFYTKDKATEFLVESADIIKSLPKKSKSIHKYSAGKVLTIAGSGKYPGAAVLASRSALKAGAGASILCFPKSVRNFVYRNLAEVVLQEYEDDNKEILRRNNISILSEKIKWADVVALGPGIGRETETQSAVIQILKDRKFKKIVIDADGIFAISKKKYKNINMKEFILTPHHGEFCSLIGIDIASFHKDILKKGRNFVKQTSAYLVLKGAPTIIFFPSGKVVINSVGNPGMAKFGTGDVLTGIIAGFLSQLHDIEKSLITSIYIHSFAGDLLAEKDTELGFTATDLMNNIPAAIKHFRKSIV
jgi:NAD(P)H-hydrate epimerase